MSRREKAKANNLKTLKKEEDQKGLQAMLNNKRANQKERTKPNQKEKVNGPLGHGIRIKIRIGIRIKETKKVKKAKMEKARPIVRFVRNQVVKFISVGGTISNKDLRFSNHLRTQDKFTTSRSILRINQFRLYSQISFEVFKIYDLQLNNLNDRVRVKHPLTMVSVLCSVSLWPSRQTQWSQTQHQSLHSAR